MGNLYFICYLVHKMKFVIAALIGVTLGEEWSGDDASWGGDDASWDDGKRHHDKAAHCPEGEWSESDGECTGDDENYERRGMGEMCNAEEDRMGCHEGLRCGVMEGMDMGPEMKNMGTCIAAEICGQETMGMMLTCGAKALTASLLAAMGVAAA